MSHELRAHDYPQYRADLEDLTREIVQACAAEVWQRLTTVRVVVPLLAPVCLDEGCPHVHACIDLLVCLRAELSR